MRIGFDATSIHGHGGLKTYARELLSALAREYPGDEFHLLTGFSPSRRERLLGLFGSFTNVIVRSAVPHPMMLGTGPAVRLNRLISRAFWQVSLSSLDLVHLTDPFGSSVLPGRPVCTIHDLFPLTRDEYRGTRLRKFYLRRASSVVRHASAILTPSEYVKKQVLEFHPEISIPLVVVPEAASEIFGRYSRENSSDLPGELEEGSYFLYVGAAYPRKNLAGLLSAYSMLPAATREKIGLVLVISGRGGEVGTKVKSLLGKIPPGKAPLLVLSDLKEDRLAGLYASAAAFVFPSLDEGFGLPVLEAMSAGCPVITSKTSCLAEVAGDAAILVDPEDPGEIAEAMRNVVSTPETGRKLASRGLERAAGYSWKKTARATMAVYRSIFQR